MADPGNPLIAQSDLTVLLEVGSPRAEEGRALLATVAELERSPEHIHTYRITPLSLWNAAAAGITADRVSEALEDLAKYPVPTAVLQQVRDQISRFGRLRLVTVDGGIELVADDPVLLVEVRRDKEVARLLGDAVTDSAASVPLGARGALKQALLRIGWPAADEAGFVEGTALELVLDCELRGYQVDAVEHWWADGSAAGGNGVLVLPCGAGKTVIGLAAMARAGASTLVVATNISAARQWITEALAKTSLTAEDIGEYSGQHKDVKAVTIATYQVLTWHRPEGQHEPNDAVDEGPGGDGDVAGEGHDHAAGMGDGDGGDGDGGDGDGGEGDPLAEFPHLQLFRQRDWGLVIYDEVHLLPAPVFRATAQIQAVRRLGLTATLVREDGKEGDVFSLIGPKRYDAPWRELEAAGWIAPAVCAEVRVGLDADLAMTYATAPDRDRYRLAATAPAKLAVLDELLARHDGDRILVIGQYLDQVREVAERVGAPIITGKTAQRAREERYAAFRSGEIPVLVVSKVANFSIDLPDANVAIQLSGTFGSRQEEAQRLGRILRPKTDGGQASFYTVVTRDTVDQAFAAKRQRFLAEQGYSYTIVDR